MTVQVTNAELQLQITSLDRKVDERHANNTLLLSEIAKKVDTLIELSLDLKLQGQVIDQLGERSKRRDKSEIEMFRRLGKVESATYAQGWAWKIVGAVLIASLAGFGWLIAQMKEFYHYEDKVDTLEFIIQGRTTAVLAPAQTSSGSK